jgi:hypothetical protein
MARYSRHACLGALACLWLAAAPAAHGQSSTIQGGTVTITGTGGRDEVAVTATASPQVAQELRVSPGVTLTTTTGSCPPDTDPLTGRPVGFRCRFSRINLLSLDLRGADDSLTVDLGEASVDAVTAAGGAGNDALEVIGLGRTLLGGDGNDTLAAPGRAHAGNAVVFSGGAGRDIADFRSIVRVSSLGNSEPAGVTASLATGRAEIRLPFDGSTRVDTLTAIEGLSGTEVGDVLTGGAGPDELLGQEGPDLLNGGDGNDLVNGGNGSDQLTAGKGADTLDGGKGIDDFVQSDGTDTLISRDGFAESTTCVSADVILNDLVDRLLAPERCASVSTAAAKHRFDTAISRRGVRLGAAGELRVRLRCPEEKPETCAGVLRARLGGRPLDGASYRIRPGRRDTIELKLSAAEARRARGKKLTLQAKEIDDDGRDRIVSRRVPYPPRSSRPAA